ncbi:TraB/GumN family protein [Marinomonas sp. GJ51-6]|uniref:TraB/GumN family protein n=1 Tax=Marinomonas sp. GJ51-6 TaxID=2992802 RepID=UPI002934B8EF|nr:TraB/GumN family protein [Marinomonas sp. GJ51-6]WOD09383.1 TraB/GumN family protein [Marinomonas sp. GJ51-6]
MGFTLLAAATFQTQAASVWKVSSETNTVYIGGTIHLLTPQDYPLPKAYDIAYQASSKIIFETNMDTISSAAFQKNLQDNMLYTDGTTLDKILPSDTYQSLVAYLNSRNIPINAVQNLKPSSLAMSLNMIELKHLGYTSEGVDMFYSRKASQENKPKGWLEEPEEQISALSSFNQENEEQIIEYALDDIKEMPSTMDKLRNSWRSGDMETMASLEIVDLKRDYPDVYESLLTKRNNLWMPQIETMLNNSQVEFIMVGAMHLAGSDSILKKLKNRGYEVKQL